MIRCDRQSFCVSMSNVLKWSKELVTTSAGVVFRMPNGKLKGYEHPFSYCPFCGAKLIGEPRVDGAALK